MAREGPASAGSRGSVPESTFDGPGTPCPLAGSASCSNGSVPLSTFAEPETPLTGSVSVSESSSSCSSGSVPVSDWVGAVSSGSSVKSQ